LDLAAQHGSFDPSHYRPQVIRLDLDPPRQTERAEAIRGTASDLPFLDAVFDAVICNHGLEHFVELEAAVSEIGRVLKPGGALYIAVPDARTLTDRVYRFLAGGGGHVNRFRSPEEVPGLFGKLTGLKLMGRRTLFTSMSFLHPANRGQARNRRLIVLLGAGERALRWATWLFRVLDRTMGTRLAIYGWAYRFGSAPLADTNPWSNVCCRCGAGHPSENLREASSPLDGWPGRYTCPSCGCQNFFTDDESFIGSV
jgi:SAM-dependent methyltransferase